MNTKVLRPPFEVTKFLKDRFYSKCIKISDDQCWIWQGAVNRNSYGAFKHEGRKVDAHVMSWRLANGGQPVPVGKLVMHDCNCRMCVNPAHLRIGDSSENMRYASQTTNREFLARGEAVWSSQLTEEQVIEIRKKYKPYVVTVKMLASEYGATEHAISDVVKRKTWKHI